MVERELPELTVGCRARSFRPWARERKGRQIVNTAIVDPCETALELVMIRMRLLYI